MGFLDPAEYVAPATQVVPGEKHKNDEHHDEFELTGIKLEDVRNMIKNRYIPYNHKAEKKNFDSRWGKDIKDDLPSDVIIEGVTCDSRKVKPGYIFVAIQGEINRGEDFIDEAIRKGASVVVTSADSDLKLDIPLIKDENPRKYLSYIIKQYGMECYKPIFR